MEKESVSCFDIDFLKNRISQMRKKRFKVAMDDFCIESSNLALLSVADFDDLNRYVTVRRRKTFLCTSCPIPAKLLLFVIKLYAMGFISG